MRKKTILEATTSKYSKPKKRVRNREKWKRNVNKRKKCDGQEYRTKSGEIVKLKSYKLFKCTCKGRCSVMIPVKRQMELHRNFYALETYNFQTEYLFALIKVVSKLRTYTQNP